MESSTQQRLADDINALASVVDDVVDKYNELKTSLEAAVNPDDASTSVEDIDLAGLESSIAELRSRILGVTDTVTTDDSASQPETSTPDTDDGTVVPDEVPNTTAVTVPDETPDAGETGSGLPTEIAEGETVAQPVIDHERQDETTDPTAGQ